MMAMAKRVIEMLADLPDLWDVNIAGDLGNDSRSSRLSAEGFQEELRFLRQAGDQHTGRQRRPVSPRPTPWSARSSAAFRISSAPPARRLPTRSCRARSAEGREDEIRECIGCNICRAANNEGVPLRCTQNPTMGEEWRRGWHPEIIPAKRSNARALVVGAGPAGLEAALSLGRRGYDVTLAEASGDLGGRLINEAALPGLGNWKRVVDHRTHMISKLSTMSKSTAKAI